jgi:hypothetical protein
MCNMQLSLECSVGSKSRAVLILCVRPRSKLGPYIIKIIYATWYANIMVRGINFAYFCPFYLLA